MNTITRLAISRIRHNRSQTILTGIAFALTTCLLMALDSSQNSHATFSAVTPAQLETLKLHLDVESITTTEVYASVVKDKMNATLRCETVVLPGVRGIGLVEGAWPAAKFEIAGPPAFFERLGYSDTAVGSEVAISYRVLGKGELLTNTFTVTGLMEQVDLSQYNVADTRIAYSARIAAELVDATLADSEREYRVSLRVKGEEQLRMAEIEAVVNQIASDIGIAESNVDINKNYLMWATDPGTEFIVAITAISVLIALFAVLVIYSIYYVAVITNVQELGKLKALGATRRQMKGLLLREGVFVAIISLPVGLLLGYLTARSCLHILYTRYWPGGEVPDVSVLSLPVVLIVILVVILTAVLSLLRPMRQVSKISAIEAIRYQEKDTGKRAARKGYSYLSVTRLSAANMSRNRRRTSITIFTMGLGGILFLSVAGIASSMDEMDYSRQHLTKGEFIVEMRYAANDETYPEQNLNSLQQTDTLGPAVVDAISAIPGVSCVAARHTVLGSVEHPGYESGKRYSISTFAREDIPAMDLSQGEIDYNAMLAGHGLLFTWDNGMAERGLRLGDTVRLTLYDGERQVPFEGVLVASTHTGEGEMAMPEELLAQYITDTNSTESLYVWVEGGVESGAYAGVKAGLQEIVDADLNLTLMSLDEELDIAHKSMESMKIALYMILGVLGVVGFMNLINTMVTSIVTRRREIGTLQAIGLSNRQLGNMLWWEGMTFTGGTLLCALTIGNILGYLGFLWARDQRLMGLAHYHYPLAETLVMTAVLVIGQVAVTYLLSRYAHKESLVQRIQA